jgi:6-phosphogluconate dehydrogenase
LVEKILDTAGQKGTGKWTGVSALDLGIPLTLIGESVFARCLSAQKDIRVKASKVISGPKVNFTGDKAQMIADLKDAFLGDIKKAFDVNPGLENLLLDPYFKSIVENAQAGWRRVCATALTNGIPVPALTSALCYFDGFRSERLPANLLQAQRDYFGAHTYNVDKPRGEFFHKLDRSGGDTANNYVV